MRQLTIAKVLSLIFLSGCMMDFKSTTVDAAPSDSVDTDIDGDTDTDSDADSDSDTERDSDLESEHPECIVYVDDDSTAPTPTGMSWDTAFPSIIDAANVAADVSGIFAYCEVWVAAGTYRIFQGDREDTLRLYPAVHFYGGFKGDEYYRSERDWGNHESIIDGRNADGTEQVYHVVTGSNQSVLDGFTITGGKADGGSAHNFGGGMKNTSASPSISHCIFEHNFANDRGGGMYNDSTSSPQISDCLFQDNHVVRNWSGGGGSGAAMYNNNNSSPVVTGCFFWGNTASLDGGAVFNNNASSPVINNTVFAFNVAHGSGGAIFNGASAPSITNCTITENSSADWGDGMYSQSNSTPRVVNSIFWNVSSNEIKTEPGSVTQVVYSDIQGGISGTGNINKDPLFINPIDGDFRLLSDSPCIDGADGLSALSTDIDGNRRIDAESANTGKGPPWVDIGAYEYQP